MNTSYSKRIQIVICVFVCACIIYTQRLQIYRHSAHKSNRIFARIHLLLAVIKTA